MQCDTRIAVPCGVVGPARWSVASDRHSLVSRPSVMNVMSCVSDDDDNGIPSYLDMDSDGDGVGDADEEGTSSDLSSAGMYLHSLEAYLQYSRGSLLHSYVNTHILRLIWV